MRVVGIVALSVLLAHSSQLPYERIIPLFVVEVVERSGDHSRFFRGTIAGRLLRGVTVRNRFTVVGAAAGATSFPLISIDVLRPTICPNSWILPDRVALEDAGLNLILQSSSVLPQM